MNPTGSIYLHKRDGGDWWRLQYTVDCVTPDGQMGRKQHARTIAKRTTMNKAEAQKIADEYLGTLVNQPPEPVKELPRIKRTGKRGTSQPLHKYLKTRQQIDTAKLAEVSEKCSSNAELARMLGLSRASFVARMKTDPELQRIVASRAIDKIKVDELQELASLHCSNDEAAANFGLHQREFDLALSVVPEFANAWRLGRAQGRIALRKRQLEILNDDKSRASGIMAIFLGKNQLKQADKPDHEQDVTPAKVEYVWADEQKPEEQKLDNPESHPAELSAEPEPNQPIQ